MDIMPKKQRQKGYKDKKISRNFILVFVGAAAIIAVIIYFALNSLIPVNGHSPVFAPPRNFFVQAKHDPRQGYTFSSQSTGNRRTLPGSGGSSPDFVFRKGELESIHVINEDSDTHSKHNFNIDQFKVHTKDLSYFESQTITFIADKNGTFSYFCTVHPEMRGLITVEG